MTLDPGAANHQAWQEIYAAHGARLPSADPEDADETRTAGSDPCLQLERQLGGRVDRARLNRLVGRRKAEILSNHAPLPGVTAFIDRARELGLMLGVATNSNRSSAEGCLRRLSLRERFDAIRGADDVNRKVPDPALYVAVCDALDVEPGESIAVQSSPRGIKSAKGAGLYCISVPDPVTGSVSMDAADLVLVSLSAITLDEVVERASRHGQPLR